MVPLETGVVFNRVTTLLTPSVNKQNGGHWDVRVGGGRGVKEGLLVSDTTRLMNFAGGNEGSDGNGGDPETV